MNREQVYVFVVCGAKEHIDALHYSLGALKQFSDKRVIVVTDSGRNETLINHREVIDIPTPSNLNHHQASIFLKTGIHRFVPAGDLYCYLDTDVVALNDQVDQIFEEFVSPVIFAPDHCVMDKFSPAAVNCGCTEQFRSWANELRSLFKRYKHLKRQPENPEKKVKLIAKLDEIKKNKLQYRWIALKFNFSRFKFRLDDDNFLDKRGQFWHDKEGNAVLYEKEDNAIAIIEETTDFRCDVNNNHRWTIEGKEVFDCRCNHLAENVYQDFGFKIADPKFQHWNGGVFLFDESSHDFLEAWHQKTLRIFSLPEWKTRDQGTLIANVWEFSLQYHATLPVRFNLIADYNHHALNHLGGLIFEHGIQKEIVNPAFVHVYHHWADKEWDVWQAIEERTKQIITPESQVVNALWIGNKLSPLELITIESFLAKGHEFKLWLYNELETPLPQCTLVGDANEIIPNSKVFRYKSKSQFGHGKGSVAGFSDVFRYKLLLEHGGWWVDMDITCLKKFDFDKPYFFRKHHDLKVVGNVIKCPKGSVLMQRCYEEASEAIDEHNTDWHKPIDILNKHIENLQLESYIVKDISNHDKWDDTSRFIYGNEAPPEHWYFLHWQNEEWRNKRLTKLHFYHGSFLAELLCNHSLYKRPGNILSQWKNEIIFSELGRKVLPRLLS